jgi:hypothetical protein
VRFNVLINFTGKIFDMVVEADTEQEAKIKAKKLQPKSKVIGITTATDTSQTGTRALYRCPFLMYDTIIDENSNAFQQRN